MDSKLLLVKLEWSHTVISSPQTTLLLITIFPFIRLFTKMDCKYFRVNLVIWFPFVGH